MKVKTIYGYIGTSVKVNEILRWRKAKKHEYFNGYILDRHYGVSKEKFVDDWQKVKITIEMVKS